MTRFLFTAGGTGGHMFPASVVAEKLMGLGHEVHFLTDVRGASYLPDSLPFTALDLSALGKRKWWSLPLVLGQLMVACLYSLSYFIRFKPEKVVGFGGYVTFPVLLMCKIFGVPYYLHEQNSVMGKVNRWFSRTAMCIMTSFPDTIPDTGELVYTGLPVRESLHALSAEKYETPAKEFNVLVIGGSQGASIFSTTIPPALRMLSERVPIPIHVHQQCRAGDLDFVAQAYKDSKITAHTDVFFQDMKQAYKNAHIVICRAGASSIAELCLVGKPALLVPFAKAMDDHQTLNAQFITKNQAGWSMAEADFTPEVLVNLLQKLIQDQDLLMQASVAMKKLGQPEATNKIVSQVTR
ncbi:MAG: undecaprenyldiphospho-muramoylpentapeptide beta-N-acetylglucosaminyltransferase [Alphaproteobacteria bacterium]|nr:undecaprenyldiphospho-muramoylpentapeptide beta-N-acetylglucosaminyltransferase [Alphaproteobacteria bacterium]